MKIIDSCSPNFGFVIVGRTKKRGCCWHSIDQQINQFSDNKNWTLASVSLHITRDLLTLCLFTDSFWCVFFPQNPGRFWRHPWCFKSEGTAPSRKTPPPSHLTPPTPCTEELHKPCFLSNHGFHHSNSLSPGGILSLLQCDIFLTLLRNNETTKRHAPFLDSFWGRVSLSLSIFPSISSSSFETTSLHSFLFLSHPSFLLKTEK